MGPSAGAERRAGEGEPPRAGGVGKVGLEHGPVAVVRVDTRPFARLELQLLDQRAHGVSCAQGATGDVA
jgi:hypothetical protein